MCKLSYTSQKFLRLHSSTLAWTNYALYLVRLQHSWISFHCPKAHSFIVDHDQVILFYVGFVQIYLSKGYQSFDSLSGTIHVTVSGAAQLAGKIYDATDLTQPASEDNAIFLTTRFFVTRNQARGTCVGSDDEYASLNCKLISNCISRLVFADPCLQHRSV
jgi:hypothetical protein